jgi:lipopolysaccharide transport system ATP-binding protein
LLVDEVLAVGDAVFQRKCLGKMSDVAQQGRAILFVSHNLEAVQRLCDRCIWLEGGRLRLDGHPETVIRAYLEEADTLDASYRGARRASTDQPIVLEEATIVNAQNTPCDAICLGEPFGVRLRWDVAKSVIGATFVVQVRDSSERLIFSANSHGSDLDVMPGTMEMICRVRENVLRPGDYNIGISCERSSRVFFDRIARCLRLRVLDVAGPGRMLQRLHREALIVPDIEWEAEGAAINSGTLVATHAADYGQLPR